MANVGKLPGDAASEPVESRRTTVPDLDPGEQGLGIADSDEESAIDVPSLGEFSAESARSTPLDEIAEAEREQAPRD